MERSLVGKPAQEVRTWVAGYIKLRKLEPLTVDQLLEEASREQGTHARVTKTKIRRAATRLNASGRSG
ncbi:MAG: hypothetical protein ACKOAU_08920 [Pirellula sp.]